MENKRFHEINVQHLKRSNVLTFKKKTFATRTCFKLNNSIILNFKLNNGIV